MSDILSLMASITMKYSVKEALLLQTEFRKILVYFNGLVISLQSWLESGNNRKIWIKSKTRIGLKLVKKDFNVLNILGLFGHVSNQNLLLPKVPRFSLMHLDGDITSHCSSRLT